MAKKSRKRPAKKKVERKSARKPAARKPAARKRATPKKAAPALRIHSVVHEVADLENASSGYAQLLADQGRRIEQGGGRHYFDLGDAVLSILDVSQGGMTPRTSGSDLYLSVPSLTPYYDRASALGWLSKADIHGQPANQIAERPWGERSFYVEDPWGNGICFVEAGTEFTGKMG